MKYLELPFSFGKNISGREETKKNMFERFLTLDDNCFELTTFKWRNLRKDLNSFRWNIESHGKYPVAIG